MSRILDRSSYLLATVLGLGRFPVAPGTVGSAAGLLLVWPVASLSVQWQCALCVPLFVIGALAAARVARRVGQEDPGLVVVDEVVGMWVTLIGLPFTLTTALLGFFFFRVMDIAKPWPARDLERWRGGWGIMADDVAAGVYAHLLLRVVLLVWPVAA